jgi:transposase
MIEPDKRKAVYLLYQEGMGVREIARRLKISPHTVTTIVAQKGEMPQTVRKDKIRIDPDLLARLYNECEGRAQRVYEKLTEEEDLSVAYSTLTQILREQGLGKKTSNRCHRQPDKVGAEMQHDTSPYQVRFGESSVRVQGSLLYFRYSKIRYLKFYRFFNRFRMKCFLHEALFHWGYAAEVCIIDNTNLARLRGTGKNAVIVPEMEQFARQYGFTFVCHEKGHANRKAGNERGFYTVETNFFPGRSFESLEDMNRQAFEWATLRSANRPSGKTRLIPSVTFEYEKAYLKKLPPYVEPPYCMHERGTDQYGYAALDGNFYWIPGTKRHDVKMLEYSDHLNIYHNRKLLGRYLLPADGIKNEVIFPEDGPRPSHKPTQRKKPTAREENILRSLDKTLDAYLNFAVPKSGKSKHRFIRELFGLYRKVAPTVFIQAVERAFKYRITDIATIENIVILKLRNGDFNVPPPEIDQNYLSRDAYIEGCFTDEADLSIYNEMEDENG